jgi:hypothetical protein
LNTNSAATTFVSKALAENPASYDPFFSNTTASLGFTDRAAVKAVFGLRAGHHVVGRG